MSDNLQKFVTDAAYRRYWKGEMLPQGQATAEAWAMAERKHFFHWFLEFPEIIGRGGFDCILGNPPYKGGQDLSGIYGHPFCHYVKWEYAPAGLSDLVVYFVRRIYQLLRPKGFMAFITTNSIRDGDVRKDGLEQILAHGGEINFAVRSMKWPGRANLSISLLAIHKGTWIGKRVLDAIDVSAITPYFDGEADHGAPIALYENAGQQFVGTHYLGDGFVVTSEEAVRLIQIDEENRNVLFPLMNGQNINATVNFDAEHAERYIIHFFDWPHERARKYVAPFQIVENKVKVERLSQNDVRLRERWWLFKRPYLEIFRRTRHLKHFFATAITTKYLNFSALPIDFVLTHATSAFVTDRWDCYSVVQSTLHEVWARKYSGAHETRLRYSPSESFETFPFPQGLWQTGCPALVDLGEHYHEHRRVLMRQLWLGLTDIYNLFHTRDLTLAQVAKVSKKSIEEAESGYRGILELRRLHRRLDIAISDAYGWTDLNLEHDFVEVETLAENDRVRYTISPAARKEVLKRLLVLNHQRAATEAAATAIATPVKIKRGRKFKVDDVVDDLFSMGIAVSHEVIIASPMPNDLGSLPNGVWERPGTDQANEEAAVLAAALKVFGAPAPIHEVRLIALLAMKPRLLTPSLAPDETTLWRRLIGAEADSLTTGITQLQPPADHAWGNAVRELRGRGRLVENLADQTWAPGQGLDAIDTEGWPNGRVSMVLRLLRQRSVNDLVQKLPESIQEWVNAQAA